MLFTLVVWTFVVGFPLVVLTFVAEVVLVVRKHESRPSTWFQFCGNALRRGLYWLGWIWAVLPDIFGWFSHIRRILRDLIQLLVSPEDLDKAARGLQKGVDVLFRAPLGYLDGIWEGLTAVRVRFISWPLFVVASLAALFLIECFAIYYDWPAVLWPTWYLGLVGTLMLSVCDAVMEALRILSDLPHAIYELLLKVKDMVPAKVYNGLLAETSRLVALYSVARWPTAVVIGSVSVVATAVAITWLQLTSPSSVQPPVEEAARVSEEGEGEQEQADEAIPPPGGRPRRAVSVRQ